jgi:hypothetical protein
MGAGIGTPQMGGAMPEQDQLARLMMEMLGGRQPSQVKMGGGTFEQSLQGSALGPLAALGGYGMQQRQQRGAPLAPPALQQRLRRRMPLMYR